MISFFRWRYRGESRWTGGINLPCLIPFLPSLPTYQRQSVALILNLSLPPYTSVAMNTYNPRPILKRGMSTSTNSDTSYDEEFVSSTSTSTSISSSSSSSSRRSVSFVKHENGTPVSHVHLTHSPCTYDRSPIKVQQNELALPKRGARTYYEGVKPRPEEQKRTQGDNEDRGRSRGRRTSMAPQDRSRMHTEGGTGSLSRKELLRREVENTSVFYGTYCVLSSSLDIKIYV